MGDESSEMWTELNSNPGEGGWAVGEDEQGYFDDLNWEPTPIDAAPGLPSTTKTDGRLSQNNVGGYCIHVIKHIRHKRSLCQGITSHPRRTTIIFQGI
jgi:hypothetical protein